MQTNPPVIELRKVCKTFAAPGKEAMPILADVDLVVREGEIVGLLGRSGSGKSTLLRIAGGLIEPTSGGVSYRGEPLCGPAAGIAVVFQTFALYPWLTVTENVELGLDALDVPPAEARDRIGAAIDMIGLDGFQSAYPRELSGGMRQRVGFARAIVGNPTLLLMDEPFSALDVLTSETLRTDFLDLWLSRELPTKAVLMVTHNIEEAVLMCDRILVLGAHPGHIAAEIPVPLPQPRNRLGEEFHAIVDRIYSILTARMTAAIDRRQQSHGTFEQPLPDVSATRIAGFLEMVAAPPYACRAELAQIAARLTLNINQLLPIAAALQMLEFAEIRDGWVRLTAAGQVFAKSDADERKRLFREHLLRFVPLVAHIRQVLEERSGHVAPRARFEYELEDHQNEADAERTLRVAIRWGRYADLFDYDDASRSFSVTP